MALTKSKMVKLGQVATNFTLIDTNGDMFNLYDESYRHEGLLVAFICNHCPYVKHINRSLAEVFQEYQKKKILVVAINSNNVEEYPDDSPEKMKKETKQIGYTFPYLFDETQKIAKEYNATCTPDFFLFDKNKKLVYRGQYDDSRPGNDKPITGKDLSKAVDAMLSGKSVSSQQKPSVGCNIKWK